MFLKVYPNQFDTNAGLKSNNGAGADEIVVQDILYVPSNVCIQTFPLRSLLVECFKSSVS